MVDPLVQQRKRGSMVAGIGALVAIGAFLMLPYINVTLVATPIGTGTIAIPYNQTFAVGTGFVTLFSGVIWIEALLAIAVLVIATLLMLREAPFGQATTPVATQLRRAAYAMLFLGIAGVAFQFLFVVVGNGQVNDLLQSASLNSGSGAINIGELLTRSSTSLNLSIGYAIGSWFYLLGMIGAIAGGAMMLGVGRTTFSAPQGMSQLQIWEQGQPSQYQQQGWQQTGQQPWQQPSQPQTGQQPWQQPSQTQQAVQHQWQQPSQTQTGQQPWQQPSQPPWQDWQGRQ